MKIFLDTETSGLDPIKNQILTIGLIIVGNDEKIIHEEEIKVSQESWAVIAKSAMQINKIDLPEHNKSAIPEIKACRRLYEILDQHSIINPPLGGHNVAFDIAFLKRMFERSSMDYPFDYHFNDTMVLAFALRDIGLLKADSLSLSKLCTQFGIKFDFHNALEDVKATHALYKKLVELIKR